MQEGLAHNSIDEYEPSPHDIIMFTEEKSSGANAAAFLWINCLFQIFTVGAGLAADALEAGSTAYVYTHITSGNRGNS